MTIDRPRGAHIPAAPLPEGVVAVPVALGQRAYDVLIGAGLLARAADLIDSRVGPAKCVIVTDENVAKRHLAPLEAALERLGRHARTEILPPGETTKSFGALARLCERILETGLERGGLVVALGGGVIGDLTGFAASIVRRGVGFVQIPTTLLAQVDSSVGGKTGINTPQGKNLIGTFHQPRLVLADTALLATLPAREFRSGYVEAAKYGLLGDAAFFGWLEQNHKAVLAHDAAALAKVVGTSVAGKAAIVARDETETGDRMLLNLGHTFGHALEAWAGYSERLLHGEAVAIGICLAFRLCQELGLTDEATVQRVVTHLAAVGLPTRIAEIPGGAAPEADTLVRIMGQDKKVRDGTLTFILVRGIGQAFVSRDIAVETVHAFLTRALGAQRA
ncbi:MAG: 3-dehydroquinate synthase [Hyphomonadaceae bacterium]|jgi:3-dehydroquinate synthase|nr:3-dehydroquinate synthase [Hyphomonadaceae bacterium]